MAQNSPESPLFSIKQIQTALGGHIVTPSLQVGAHSRVSNYCVSNAAPEICILSEQALNLWNKIWAHI